MESKEANGRSRRRTPESLQASEQAKRLGCAKSSARAEGDTAIVWKLHADNSMEPVKVSLGITDHAFTEIAGVLKGD